MTQESEIEILPWMTSGIVDAVDEVVVGDGVVGDGVVVDAVDEVVVGDGVVGDGVGVVVSPAVDIVDDVEAVLVSLVSAEFRIYK